MICFLLVVILYFVKCVLIFLNMTTPENAAPITTHLPTGLSAVEHDIVRACKEARRDRASVTLVAVSKTFDANAIVPVIEAGQRVFGENRVQEATAK